MKQIIISLLSDIKMPTKTLNKTDYTQEDSTTFRSKKEMDFSRYVDEYGNPYWVNMRVDVGWGYIDDKGKVWSVNWV